MMSFSFRVHPAGIRVSALLIAATLSLLPGARAGAQWGVWSGDSLLAAGRLDAAESAYYVAARTRPRDPHARAALGRYLAARGAVRVGTVLLEEARFFGGDSVGLAHALVPLYERLGDYEALVNLRPGVLERAELQRARWLTEHPTAAAFSDSVIVLTYRPVADGSGIGTVILRIGKTELPATIDPRVSGLVFPQASRPELRSFGTSGKVTLAVAEAVRLGGATFSNVPASVTSDDGMVRIGFDVIAPYSPDFDPVNRMFRLRRTDRHSRPRAGLRVPALFDSNGVRLHIGGRWHPTSSESAGMLLATRPWIWDARRGDVILLTR